MNPTYVAYIVMLLCGFALDYIWLTFIAKKFYKAELGSLIRKDTKGDLDPKMIPATLFYLIYILAILVFVVLPNRMDTILEIMPLAAFFGFTAYATYDLTNYATFKDFSRKVALVDMAWGTVMTTVVAIIGLLVL